MEYALYKGDTLLTIGTLKEIAKEMGVKYKTLMCYKTPSHINRHKGNGRILVEIGEE